MFHFNSNVLKFTHIMKKIIITGGNGFIGKELVKLLYNKFNIFVFDKNIKKNYIKNNIFFFNVDILNLNT